MPDAEISANIINILNSVLSNSLFIISMLLIIMVSACFLGRYIVLTRKLVLSSLGILMITILTTVAYSIILPGEVSGEMLFNLNYLTTGLMLIYAFVFYLFAHKEKRLIRAIESTICMYLFTLYISTLSQMTAIYYTGGTDKEVAKIYVEEFTSGATWLLILSQCFIITAAVFAIVYFGFYRPKKMFVIPVPYRIFFIIWILIFTIVPFYPAVLPSENITINERYSFMSFLFAIGIELLGLIVPIFMIVSSTERALSSKNKYQETYLAAELEYINQYKKQQTETKAFRHDIKNNLAVTQMMLDEGQIEEARKHITDMLGNVSSLSQKYATGDDMLDIIVSMKADRMEELGITFSLDGVADDGLKMKPMDMCSIFANALDNAIEAASDCESPFVSFNIKRTDKFFIIKIINSTKAKADIGKLMSSSGYTSKDDKEHHGFGLLNIRRSVENYNGVLKAEATDSTFTLSVMIPRQGK